MAQKNGPENGWHMKSTTKKNMGIDAEKAYEMIKDKQGKEVVVAVIDGGTDIEHPDLKGNIWHNPGEIAFNGIDDDNNGYVDDTVGWNFIGGADGGMVDHDNLEMTRLVRYYNKKYETVTASDISGSPSRRAEYEFYQKLKRDVEQNKSMYSSILKPYEKSMNAINVITDAAGTKNPTMAQLEALKLEDEDAKRMRDVLAKEMKSGRSFEDLYNEFNDSYKQLAAFAKYHYNVDYDPRSIVGDNYDDASERFYGNNNVKGPDAGHGTHVAGIVAAVRNNGQGMDGVANNAKIMVIRVVPNGDERDKDVANGIRYAVDNGAKIINMSFGKAYKWNKAAVDSAVEYAVSKGVLLVHAAGNDNKNTDIETNYPNDSLGNGKFAASWVEVGASAPSRKKLAADFSNYAKHNVDLFAPGVSIYSTTPENGYEAWPGTSMAAPVVSGVAALVWSYYPNITAVQMKEILMKSAVVVKKKVPAPGEKRKVKFTELSVSGGVVNAANALKMAESLGK